MQFTNGQATIMLVATALASFGTVVGVSAALETQTEIYDKIFQRQSQNGTVFAIYNETSGQYTHKTNFSQVIIYNWGSLSEHAKDVIRNSMELNGYQEGSRVLRED